MTKKIDRNDLDTVAELPLDALDNVLGGAGTSPMGMGGSLAAAATATAPTSHGVGYHDHFGLHLGASGGDHNGLGFHEAGHDPHAASQQATGVATTHGPSPVGMGGSNRRHRHAGRERDDRRRVGAARAGGRHPGERGGRGARLGRAVRGQRDERVLARRPGRAAGRRRRGCRGARPGAGRPRRRLLMPRPPRQDDNQAELERLEVEMIERSGSAGSRSAAAGRRGDQIGEVVGALDRNAANNATGAGDRNTVGKHDRSERA